MAKGTLNEKKGLHFTKESQLFAVVHSLPVTSPTKKPEMGRKQSAAAVAQAPMLKNANKNG